MSILELTYYGNTLLRWLLALIVFIVVTIILRIAKGEGYKRLITMVKKTATDIDDLIIDLIKRTRTLFLIIVSLYAASLLLNIPPSTKGIIISIVIISLLIQSAIWGNTLIDFWINRYKTRYMEKDAASVTTISALGFISRFVLYTIVVLLALDNLGIDITALIAGLGVGGIAVALAVQNILGDLFASLSIVLDKPFVIGDFIIVDDLLGTVEHVGLKTTRIRSLSGEQIVFSNTDLLKSRIRNYKRMFERRVLFSLGVTYQTPYEKLQAIPGMIREIVESQELTRFDRAHFKDYGNFSLNFEVVYYVRSPDYNTYMDIQQAINLAIYQRFDKEGIEFAYPTQTLYINKEGAG